MAWRDSQNAEIGVALPLLARIAVQKLAHVLRPAIAAGKIQDFAIGG